MTPLRAALALSVLLLLPGCLETPCSRHNQLCGAGGGGDDDDVACETFPQAATGILGADDDATDVWALRVTAEFEDLQVRTDDGDWQPETRMWQDATDWDEGLNDCTCASTNGGCPQVGVEVDEPGWVFVEVWDATSSGGDGRGYTLNAVGVQTAVLIRDAVPRAGTPAAYGTTPPGLCERNRVNTDVQLPWFQEIESGDSQWLGALDEPGVCVLGTIYGCTTDRDLFAFQKVGSNPTRLTLLFEPMPADLDVVMTPGGTGQTTDNPETILGSVPAGATADIEVTCQAAEGVTSYGMALETY